jgi:hypothetical protein
MRNSLTSITWKKKVDTEGILMRKCHRATVDQSWKFYLEIVDKNQEIDKG